ncbi:hypothetical protein LSTR_LSTR012634 [Laodelphax striatellus]|uniref:Chitin-binding type-2 domain-containing protein n=1 Tax=Laodelphax striatellus TaxID=195883 RepID=A0A482XR10_LAOST|nr:hypothetical protein LSTR_LSTR012634 [Laodelphax striatellus]
MMQGWPAVLLASLLLLLFWKRDGISSAAEPGYLDFDNLPETNFSCESKVIGGYYADVETGCQMFHVCTIGQKGEITDIKFLCLNGTVFDQETRVCERLDEVDCSKTESFFDLNLQLYGNKAGPFGIEPENEEIVEEECDPEDEEECQRTEDGGVREDEEEESGGGGEKVPSNNNGVAIIQQTTFSPISATTTTTKRPNVFSSTSTARVPTTTLQPSTTGQPAFQSGDPDTIAALLALHNAFAQSLQHHDINNKQQQEQQQAQQQEQIEQQQREIEEHQRKQHLQQIHQQKQQAQLQHQQAQLQHHQAQLHHQQQKITQQAAKQAANAYVAAVNSQAPTPKPLPPPPPPLRQVPQQVLQQHVPQSVQQVPQTSTHRFPIHYDASKHPTNTPLQQDAPLKVLQQQHRFPQQQVHYESSTPQQDAPQQRFPQQDAPQQRFPQPPQLSRYEPAVKADASRFPQAQGHYEVAKSPVIGAQQERFGGGAYVSSQQNFGQNARLPVQSAERPKPFSFHQYDSQPSTTASPYLLHQLKVNRVKQEQQHSNFPRQAHAQRSITTPAVAVVTSTSTTTSIRSGKKGQPHTGSGETFLGSSVTSTSSEVTNGTLSSGEYDEYQEGDVATDPFFQDVPKIGRSRREVASVNGFVSDNEFEKSNRKIGSSRRGVAGVKGSVSDNEFEKRDPKIGRSRREVAGVKGSIGNNRIEKSNQKIVRSRREVADVKGFVSDNEFEKSDREIGRSRREVAGVKGSVSNNGIEKSDREISRSRREVAGVKGSVSDNEFENSDRKIGRSRREVASVKGFVSNNGIEKSDQEIVRNQRDVTGVKESIIDNLFQKEEATFLNEKIIDRSRRDTGELRRSINLGSDSLGNENIYKSRKLVKREARYVQDDDDDDERYVERGDEEDEENHVGRRKNKSSRRKNLKKSSKNRNESSKNRKKSSKNRKKSKKTDKRNRKVEKVRQDRDRDVESLESSRERSEEERSREREESEEEVKKINRKSKVGSNRKPSKKTSTSTTTPKPVETTEKPKEPDMKNIPLDNNEFTDIIDKVQQTISAKVVSIQQPNIHKNKDNLQLSPEERKYYTEVAAVMSKYIPPPVETESLEEGESTPNMSARDKQRLSMFVTSKAKRKKKKSVGTYVIRNKRQASKENKQYEVSEVVDEPTTQEPSARRLINQYRTSGIVPSQLISELIQRMDLSSREQVSEAAVSSLRNPNPQIDSRRQIGEQVRSRVSLPSRRPHEQAGVLENVQVRNVDPNTQSLRDVISNGGHHRMVLRKGSRRVKVQSGDLGPSDQDTSSLPSIGHVLGSSSQDESNLGSRNPGKITLSNKNHPDGLEGTSGYKDTGVKSKQKVVSSSEESLEKDDSDSSIDYSLEKEESNPRLSSSLKTGEKVRETYAVSEEDEGDEKPSTNLPFLYQDQIGRANTGEERYSSFDSGSSLQIPIGVDTPRGNLNDRTSNYHKATRAPTLEVSTTPVAATIPVAFHRGDANDRISNYHKITRAPSPVAATTPGAATIPVAFSRGDSNDRISNYHKASKAPTSVAATTPKAPCSAVLNQRISNYHRGSNSDTLVDASSPRDNLNDRISNFHKELPSSSGRQQESSRTTYVGSQESTRVRNRPTGSQRKFTTNVSDGGTDSESTTDSRVTPVPRRRRPTSRARERSEEPVETSSESSRSTGLRRRRPTSRVRENLEENIPQVVVDGDVQSRQSQRSRSRENLNLTVGNTEPRSSGRASLVKDDSRTISDSFRPIPESSRPIPEGARVPDNSWLPDSSRAVLESSKLLPESSKTPESSQLIPEDSRTIPNKPRLVTSRRRPANVDRERFEEERKQIVNIQQTPRKNGGVSRTRQQPSLVTAKESTTESSEAEEEVEGETTDSYESQAKKLHRQLFPGENFSCEGKIKGGFYADIETDCRGFFICSQGEINGPLLKSHFWCGEATKFNQRSRTCQADYLVECSISTRYFGLNNDFAVPTLETNTFEPQKVS